MAARRWHNPALISLLTWDNGQNRLQVDAASPVKLMISCCLVYICRTYLVGERPGPHHTFRRVPLRLIKCSRWEAGPDQVLVSKGNVKNRYAAVAVTASDDKLFGTTPTT